MWCRDYDAALAHFAAMLHCPRSAPYWQAQYLRQFLDCMMQAAAVKVRHGSIPDSGQGWRPVQVSVALACTPVRAVWLSVF